MIRCLLVDDTAADLHLLESLLREFPDVEIVAACNNPLEAQRRMQADQPDVVFSDVEMPLITGVELLQSLAKPPLFVFVTSYADYAIAGFENNAVDFLLKPATFPRLLKALERVRTRLGQTAPEAHVSSVSAFWVKSDGKYVQIAYEDVRYVEAVDNFIKIFTTRGETHIVWQTLRAFEEQLRNPSLVRIHRSFLVNLRYVTSIGISEVELGNQSLPLSRSHRDDLMALIRSNLLSPPK